MKIIKVDNNSEEWLEARKGKITGSKLKDIVTLRGNNKKIGFYEIMSERLGAEETEEDPMERGHSLEAEAIQKFTELTKKEVETNVGLCVSDFNDNIALSPDGLIGNKEAIEVKCLASAKHLQTFFENKIPDEYFAQAIQYFIVLEKLETLHFCFYDPRLKIKPFFVIDITRKELEDDIKFYKDYQIQTLKEIDTLLEKLLY